MSRSTLKTSAINAEIRKAQAAAAIPAAADHALALADDQRQSFSPMLAILSAQHETQYSRLFRS